VSVMKRAAGTLSTLPVGRFSGNCLGRNLKAELEFRASY
jgi:hypothetical protein